MFRKVALEVCWDLSDQFIANLLTHTEF